MASSIFFCFYLPLRCWQDRKVEPLFIRFSVGTDLLYLSFSSAIHGFLPFLSFIIWSSLFLSSNHFLFILSYLISFPSDIFSSFLSLYSFSSTNHPSLSAVFLHLMSPLSAISPFDVPSLFLHLIFISSLLSPFDVLSLSTTNPPSFSLYSISI
ncbi:unnamed protein product [Acanthosepion pharaonis]|uniref:Uncharacterized protein n=1 Tax=Acanthosepion pharaonis TaxID=158019 RepID=A0A812DPS7_ACAPH|nr:unnamed protein product [Sepia pharaonis]